jgi:CHAD domain-containing protein
MHKSYAERYIKKQFNQLRKNILRSFNLKNKEAIHDFRVALKRIVAIVKFAKKQDLKKNISKAYKVSKLDFFFQIGGQLREIHINRRILKTYIERYNYRFYVLNNYLKGKEKMGGRLLKQTKKKISFKKIRKFESLLLHTFHDIPEAVVLSYVDQFISIRIAEIEKLIMDHYVESKLHRIRKLVKSIKYMLELSGMEKRSYGTLNFTIEKITLLEDHIGHWHDLYLFKSEVSNFQELINRKKKPDMEVDFLMHIVGKDYDSQFHDTVQHIYKDFDITYPANPAPKEKPLV